MGICHNQLKMYLDKGLWLHTLLVQQHVATQAQQVLIITVPSLPHAHPPTLPPPSAPPAPPCPPYTVHTWKANMESGAWRTGRELT